MPNGYGGGQLMIRAKNNHACSAFDWDSLHTGFGAQEMAHGLGLPHSYDDANPPNPYSDYWDSMSCFNCAQFTGANFPDSMGNKQAGPGFNVPNLLQMGWLPPDKIMVYQQGSPDVTVNITALSHPSAPDFLAVKLESTNAMDYYTVEFRKQDGWDAGIPGDTVLIHEYKVGQTPYSFLQHTTMGQQLVEGGQWIDPTKQFKVTVTAINSAAAIATLSIGGT
jgi:hypothetical protein